MPHYQMWTHLNPGFDVREMVHCCENCLPLVLVSQVSVGRAICREGS